MDLQRRKNSPDKENVEGATGLAILVILMGIM